MKSDDTNELETYAEPLFTADEAGLLLETLGQLKIEPAHPNAPKVVAVVQSAIAKIRANAPQPTPN